MSHPKKAPDIAKLFHSAHQEGILSGATLQTLDIPDLGARIQDALGVSVDDLGASEVLLVTLMPDDSGSIRCAGNADAIREGHNLVLDALSASKNRDGILVHTRYLNGAVLFPYCPLSQAVRMDGRNYNPMQGTPLYDQTITLLATVLAKSQELAEHGVAVRTVTLILTDGSDQHSVRATAAKVAGLANDLLKGENHIIAALGVEDGTTDFRRVFRSMGIRDEWILTAGSTAGEIRRAFQVFSRSAVAASQGGKSFSSSRLGGFTVN